MERMFRNFLAGLTAAVISGIPGAWADGVVVSSTAPGFAAGRVLADSETLHLPADSVTVMLLSSGQVVTVGGPYDGTAAAAPSQSDVRQASGLSDWQRPDLSALGGARSNALPALTAPAARGPDLIDASASGRWCFEPKAGLRIKAPPEPRLLHLEEDGARVTLAWPPAVGDQKWPTALPLHDGSHVVARWGENGAPHELDFHAVGNPADTAAARLVAWSQAGCHHQAGPPLSGLGARLAPFSLYLSTDRGRTPRYAIGEPVTLIMQANRPAALYCFILQDGHARPAFASGTTPINLAEQSAMSVRADILSVDITAPPPSQTELRCYAVLASSKMTVAADNIEAASSEQPGSRLDRLFGEMSDGELARAHVMIETQ
jgi:hypothetical protein